MSDSIDCSRTLPASPETSSGWPAAVVIVGVKSLAMKRLRGENRRASQTKKAARVYGPTRPFALADSQRELPAASPTGLFSLQSSHAELTDASQSGAEKARNVSSSSA